MGERLWRLWVSVEVDWVQEGDHGGRVDGWASTGTPGMVKLRVLFGLIDFALSLSRGSIESMAGRFAG
ncbi:hypothetical protein M0R45_005030 [Rubus argutus]|uniref:Uncharacterized protein n=1 Tax=Rubus argutus TaxID=59490 RepID=A0AAW1YLF7_RUBAR